MTLLYKNHCHPSISTLAQSVIIRRLCEPHILIEVKNTPFRSLSLIFSIRSSSFFSPVIEELGIGGMGRALHVGIVSQFVHAGFGGWSN
jgi:hypothetical protein